MKAMIFAAGLGTRLKPYTDTKPKALVEVNGKPLLEHAIEHLASFGFNEIVINTHHFGNQIIDFIHNYKNTSVELFISDESEELLDTGGGLVFAKHFFEKDENFVLYNVDIISDLNLKSLMLNHIQTGALATLAIRERKSSRYFVFDENLRLKGWKNSQTGQEIGAFDLSRDKMLAFSGIHAVNASIFDYIHQDGKFSITPIYLDLAKDYKIMGHLDNSGYWLDCGKPEHIEKAASFLT